jgi:hypothetical protein
LLALVLVVAVELMMWVLCIEPLSVEPSANPTPRVVVMVLMVPSSFLLGVSLAYHECLLRRFASVIVFVSVSVSVCEEAYSIVRDINR